LTRVRLFSFQTSDGLTLAGECAGRFGAPSVVLLHGIGQTRNSWRSAQRELVERGYYVVSLDARGHGESQWADDAALYDFTLLTDDLASIVSMLPNKPAIVGASMGGLTAMYALGSQPDFAAVLILVDIVPRPEKAGADRVLRFMHAHPHGFADLKEAAAAVGAYNPDRPTPRSIHGLAKSLRQSADGRLRWHWDPKFVDKMWQDKMHKPELLLRNCRRFSKPVMLVRGLKSDIVSDESIYELRESLPQLLVFDIAAAGHMIVGDKNELFNVAVIEFLRQHLPA
jgi:pimeloyl-ACP methyl ester carboxylesterase